MSENQRKLAESAALERAKVEELDELMYHVRECMADDISAVRQEIRYINVDVPDPTYFRALRGAGLPCFWPNRRRSVTRREERDKAHQAEMNAIIEKHAEECRKRQEAEERLQRAEAATVSIQEKLEEIKQAAEKGKKKANDELRRQRKSASTKLASAIEDAKQEQASIYRLFTRPPWPLGHRSDRRRAPL